MRRKRSQMDSIIKKYGLDISCFESAKSNYYTHCNRIDNLDYNVSLAKRSFEEIGNKFIEILRICAQETKVKENADLLVSSFSDLVPRSIFCGEKTCIEITIGLFRGFYISTDLRNIADLRSMNDEFWVQLVSLSQLGEFEFRERNKPAIETRREYPHLFNRHGNLYRLFRNYFFSQIGQGKPSDLGPLVITWEHDMKFDKVIERYIEAFKILYKLNLLLVKQESRDIDRKNL